MSAGYVSSPGAYGMTATVGVSFSAGSVAKRILLFTLNVLVLVGDEKYFLLFL